MPTKRWAGTLYKINVLVSLHMNQNDSVYQIYLPLIHFSIVCFVAELYDYCIKEGYADKNLIAKWKKQGYENLCCLRCIQTRDTNFGTNCICRVPKSKLEVVSLTKSFYFVCVCVCALQRAVRPDVKTVCVLQGRIIECTHCGCRGCSG